MSPARKSATGPEPDLPEPVDQPVSYEAARDELIDVVRRLEAGGVTLEESLALWERGEQLATVCQRWLDGARARLQTAAPSGESTGGFPDDDDDETDDA